MLTFKSLVEQFNVVARTEYNKRYKEFEPDFKSILFEYQSGSVASVDFPFTGFLRGMEKFTGSREHQTFPKGYKFTVTNEEYDMAVDVPVRELKRSAKSNNLNGLDLYKKRIQEMPKLVKDHPVTLAFDMLEAGDSNTFGTCFDGQNLLDTTHDYSTSAGTQSNIVTGAGTTEANILADLDKVVARFEGFYISQADSGNSKKLKLNENLDKLMVVCPVELGVTFRNLNTKDTLASGESNPWKGRLKIVTKHFTDVNDWYAVLDDDPVFKPFLYQVEEYAVLDFPNPADEGLKERKVATYGANGSYTVAYGAWWKVIQVTNT